MSADLLRYAVAEAALRWVGTPFFPHMAKRGIGADCVNLGLAVYQEAGVIPEGVTLPKYSLDGGEHMNSSTVIQWLESSPWFRREDIPGIGSLITLRVGKVEHHVGIITGERTFIQAVRRYGVIISDRTDSTWASRFMSSWAPVKT